MIVHLTINGELIETTPEHPFYTIDGEWIAAGYLEAGDQILSLNNSYGMVESVVWIADPQALYNLTVEGVHTFAVGDGQWVVHNCGVGDVNEFGLLIRDRGELSDNATITLIGRMDDLGQDMIHLDPDINTW